MFAFLGPLLGFILNIVGDMFKVSKEQREAWAKMIEYSQKKKSDSVKLKLAAREQKLKKQEALSKFYADKLKKDPSKK